MKRKDKVKAIVTKFHPAGSKLPERYSATDNDGNRVVIRGSDMVSDDDNHAVACRKLCLEMGWSGSLVRGQLLGVGHVWVWRQEGLQCADELVIAESEVAK